MTTTKPKIQGYISQWLGEQFEAERERWDLTQSQTLERILFERYSDQKQVESTNLVRADDRHRYLVVPGDNRLQYLEEQVRQLLQRVTALEITSNLESDTVDEQITSNLESDTVDEQITSNLESDTVDEQITSNLESDTVDEQITSNLESDTVDEQITSNLESDTVDEQITSNLESDTVDEQITSNLESDTVDEQITSNLESDTVDEQITSNLETDYQWMTFEAAWSKLPVPKPKDWDDGEQGMLKTRAKRQLWEARTGSEHWVKFAVRLFRTIGLEVDVSRDEDCFRLLPEPIPHVWNLYDPDNQLAAGGFRLKRDAQAYCCDYEDRVRVALWRWDYEPCQLSLLPRDEPVIELETVRSPDSGSLTALSTNGLAQRLQQKSRAYIQKIKLQPKFSSWSRQHDPDGVGWRYDAEANSFFPDY